jgi:hypothetical protein
MATVTVPWSKLLQQPNQVTAELESSDAVRLVRRDGDDLILTTADRNESAFAEMEIIARVFSTLIRHEEAARVALLDLPELFPWTHFLPQEGVREFLAEFVETARACAEIRVFAPLEGVVAAWRHTAEIYADPEVYARLTQSFDPDQDGGPVHPPEVPE